MEEIYGEAEIHLEGMYTITDLKEAITYLELNEKRGKELKADMSLAIQEQANG